MNLKNYLRTEGYYSRLENAAETIFKERMSLNPVEDYFIPFEDLWFGKKYLGYKRFLDIENDKKEKSSEYWFWVSIRNNPIIDLNEIFTEEKYPMTAINIFDRGINVLAGKSAYIDTYVDINKRVLRAFCRWEKRIKDSNERFPDSLGIMTGLQMAIKLAIPPFQASIDTCKNLSPKEKDDLFKLLRKALPPASEE